jgi:ribosome maturation factor RimP
MDHPMDDERLALIQQLAEPILEAASTEAVEWMCHLQGGRLVVRLLVDKVSGVTIQDCARLNRQIGQALDQVEALSESYTLEVSSPGLDRPLVTRRDFERAIGDAVNLCLQEAVGGARQLEGELLVVQPEALVVVTPTGNVTVPLAAIQRAVKVIRL